MDMEFPRGRRGTRKVIEIPEGGGVPPWWYGNFVEPHIEWSKCFIVEGLIQKGNQRELVHLTSVLFINIIFGY